MPAGPIVVYNHALLAMARGQLDLASLTLVVCFVGPGYTPSGASHSSYPADISLFQVGAQGVALQGRTLSMLSDSYVWADADDQTLSVNTAAPIKYVVARTEAGLPVFYFDVDTDEVSGVETTQALIRMPQNGFIGFRR